MNATQSTTLQVLLFAALIIWRLVRKMQARPVRSDRQTWRLPLILTAIGGYETVALTGGKHPVHFEPADVTYLVLAAALSIVLGVVRGTTVRIEDRGGMLMQRYTLVTVGLWLVTIVLRLGVDVASTHVFGVAAAVAGTSILMMFGLSLLGESATVALRAGMLGGGSLGGPGGPRAPRGPMAGSGGPVDLGARRFG